MIEFPKRCRREFRNAFERRIWESLCGRYRVVHSRCLLGPQRGREAKKNGLRPVWYAVVWHDRDRVWDMISRHRTQKGAFAACQRAAGSTAR